MTQKNNRNLLILFIFTLTLLSFQLWRNEAQAQSSYYTTAGCVNCHTTTSTCNGCHAHGTHATSTKNTINVTGTTDKASYAPGETVTVTITGGYRTGWVRAALFDQNGAQLAVSSGTASGMGSSTTLPATLTAPAPSAAGTYTWKAGWYGNEYDSASAAFGAGWTPDPGNPGHGYEMVSISSFTVASAAPAPAADTAAPVVDSFTLPASATSLTVPVSALSASDNVAVTGYLVTTSATAPAAAAAEWSATAPASVTAVEGGNTFYAWAKDAAGNVSLSKSASVTVTVAVPTADTTKPTLAVSALADGSYTNKVTLNISGSASDAGGLKSVTVNGEPVVVNADGSFSAALTLVDGPNTITVVAADLAGNEQSNVRTITFDPTMPVLAITAPADNSNSAQSFVTVTGTINETSTVTVTDNSGNQSAAAITGNTFSATVNLVAGVNTITITATDLAGNTTSAKRTVTYASAGVLTMAVTYPAQDITTRKNSIVLSGSVADAIGKVTVLVRMKGRTYTPVVEDNGLFKQQLNFKRPGLYAITVTATDAAGNSSEVTRNVIYRKDRGKRAGVSYEHDDD